MVSELDDRLASVVKMAPKINEVADRVNQLVARIEKTLSEKAPGTVSAESSEIERRVEETDGESFAFITTLAYDSELGIHFAQEKWGDDEDDDRGVMLDRFTIPWKNASREWRLKAAPGIADLLTNIADNSALLLKNAEDAARALENFLEDDGGREPSES